MVVDGLESREGEEKHSLACGHSSQFVGNTGANGVKQEAFEWVVVESAVCIWYV